MWRPTTRPLGMQRGRQAGLYCLHHDELYVMKKLGLCEDGSYSAKALCGAQCQDGVRKPCLSAPMLRDNVSGNVQHEPRQQLHTV